MKRIKHDPAQKTLWNKAFDIRHAESGNVWTAYCDGASRGNPGPASYGVLVCNPKGVKVKEAGDYLGETTNQVAEYRALIRALEELSAAGARRARILTDSEFVAKQFSGEYRVRDERMKALMARVRALESGFESVEVKHIRRMSHPHNARADALANKVLDNVFRQPGIAPPKKGGEESPSSTVRGAP